MKYQNKKVLGIWMDKDHAELFHTPDYSIDGEFQLVEKVKSTHHGQHGSSEHVAHHKKNLESQKFFKALSQKIADVDAVYIIGPGQSQEQFRNFLREDKHFSKTEIELGTADHLSPNQVIAKIRNHFNQH
ncbi:MAG: hypothetical protein IPM26_09415 [Saprospiraceae bacterium]|nr:hypothetical protein [Saprospiraceae bacterium]